MEEKTSAVDPLAIHHVEKKWVSTKQKLVVVLQYAVTYKRPEMVESGLNNYLEMVQEGQLIKETLYREIRSSS